MPNELVALRWANPRMVEFIKKSSVSTRFKRLRRIRQMDQLSLYGMMLKQTNTIGTRFTTIEIHSAMANGMGFAHVITRDFGKWDKHLNLKTSFLVRIHNTRTFTSANGLHFQITSLTPRRATVTIHFSAEHVHFPVAKVFTSEKEVIITFPPPTVKNNYLPFYIMQRDITIECPWKTYMSASYGKRTIYSIGPTKKKNQRKHAFKWKTNIKCAPHMKNTTCTLRIHNMYNDFIICKK